MKIVCKMTSWRRKMPLWVCVVDVDLKCIDNHIVCAPSQVHGYCKRVFCVARNGARLGSHHTQSRTK